MIVKFLVLFTLLACVQLIGASQFKLASIYQNNMVLQREPYKARIWGYADESSSVSVTVFGKVYNAEIVKVSWTNVPIWKVLLDPIEATDSPVNIDIMQTTSDGSVTNIKIKSVLFGDVWVCGGQSNMNMSLKKSFEGEIEALSAFNYTNIRIIKVPPTQLGTQQFDFNTSYINPRWSLPVKDRVNAFSGLCWYFGKELFKELNVPIGLVQVALGGSEIEKFMSSEALDACKTPRRRTSESKLWNAMVYPLTTLSIYGAIWYQGETNVLYNPDFYKCNFPVMINDWRQKWFSGTDGATNPNFPFGFVQIANRETETTSVGPFPWLRFHQTCDYGYAPNPALNNVFMATAVDLVDNYFDSVHPRNKVDVAKRLSLGALGLAYNKPVDYSAPRVLNVKYKNSQILISFVSEPLNRPFELKLNSENGFEVCCDSPECYYDEDTIWQKLNGATVRGSVVSFKKVENCTNAKYVRYLWRQKPCEFKQCALYTANTDLPVTPFITAVN